MRRSARQTLPGGRPGGTIDGHTYRSTVAVYGGEHVLPLNAVNRARAGVNAGQHVEVDVELDTEPRTVDVPAELTTALDADPILRHRFDALSCSRQRAHDLDREREGDRHPPAPRHRGNRRAAPGLRHPVGTRTQPLPHHGK